MNRPPKGDDYRRGNFAGMMFQPSANDTPDMTIRIKPGSFWINNEKFIEYEGGVSPVISAPSSGAKWVLVAINKAGKCVIVNGLPRANNPEPPTLSQNMLPLAFVYIKSSTNVITNDMVYDARPEFAVGGYPINHNDLQNRNKENAHTIEAISGLREELDEKITSTDAKELIRNKAEYNGTNSASFTLNIDDSGVPVEHCGIYVNRGSQPKVGIKYNEDLDEWQYTNNGTDWLSWNEGANIPQASATEYGTVKLSVDPENEPIAVGINDPKYLSIDEKVTKNDLRNIYITREEVLNKLEDKMDVEGTYSKDDINSIFVTKSMLDNLSLDTYNRSQIDSFLSVKANASQVYSKVDVDSKLLNFYTKPETDAMFGEYDWDLIKNLDLSNYYLKNEVDLLLQNVVTNTYTRTALDAMLENKANASEIQSALNGKVNASDVYFKDYIDNKFNQSETDAKNKFYEKAEIDILVGTRALVEHNHSSADIIEDSAHKFVSESQIESWNAKQNALGFTPEDASQKGVANGYAPLDNNGQIPIEYIPNESKDETNVVDTYNDLLIIPDKDLKEGKQYVVLDATGDPSGITGRAEYYYHNGEFICISHVGPQGDMTNYYNKVEVDDKLAEKANLSDLYSKSEIDTAIENAKIDVSDKADKSSVYEKSEINAMLSEKAAADNVYSKDNIDLLLNAKANANDVYTKNEVDNAIAGIDTSNFYTKSEVDDAITASTENVYTKEEVNALIPEVPDVSDFYTKSENDALLSEKAAVDAVYSKEEVDTKISEISIDAYTKSESDELLNAKANASDVYTKAEVDNAIAQNSPKVMQEFTSNGCTFIAYDNDAVEFTKNGNSITIIKNKEVKSLRFNVSTDEIGSNNRILIDYDANATNNDQLTYDYANVQYIQLMGSKGATRVGTNIYYTNDNNPHYCECALSFGNQGPVVVKITY